MYMSLNEEEYESDISDLDMEDLSMDTDKNEEQYIDDYIKNEKMFDKFYRKSISEIFIYFLYIDKNNEIIKCLKNKYKINNNVLLKSEILDIISEHDTILNKNFNLNKMIKYNFTIENNNLNQFINNSENFKYIDEIHEIKDIFWDKSIPLFFPLNSLYFIFYEKKSNNTTKKIKLKRKRDRKRKTKKLFLKNKSLTVKNDEIIKIEN